MSVIKKINEKVVTSFRSLLGLKDTNEEINLTDIIPILNIEDDALILRTGRVAIGFELESVQMETWQSAGYAQAASTFYSSLKTLEDDSIVQKIDYYYYQYNSKERGLNFFEGRFYDHFIDRPVLMHKSYIFVISACDDNRKKAEFNNSLVFANKYDTKETLKNIVSRKENWEKITAAFINELSNIGDIKLTRMDSEKLKLLYRQNLNLEFRFDPGEPYKTISNKETVLNVGEKKVNVLTLTEQAKGVEYSRKNAYGVESPFTYNVGIYFQEPHIVVTSFWKENTDVALKKLETQRKVNFTATELGSEDAKIQDNELAIMTDDIRANQKTLVSMNKSIIISTLTDHYREKLLSDMVSQVRSWDSANVIQESYNNMSAFWGSLPGNASENIRWILMPSDVAACYMDFTTTSLGYGAGDYFSDRFRNPIHINLFNVHINNQNVIVIGPSGSGKSYFINHLVIQRKERNERQIIIDNGGTYKNNIEALNGKYYEYNPENPISFNPFLVPITEKYIDGAFQRVYDCTADKKTFILSVIGLLWKDNDLEKGDKSVLYELITLYFEYENNLLQKKIERVESSNKEKSVEINVPCLYNFFNWLISYDKANEKSPDYLKKKKQLKVKNSNGNDPNEGFDNLIVVLQPFVYGDFRKLLNNESVVDISEDNLVCFDMARIKDDLDLYRLITMLMTELSLDIVRKFPNDIKYFAMDEAWSMLSDGMGGFVEYMYRTLRKNKGSMCIITQGILEIIESTVGQAIINNADTKIILRHDDANKIEELCKHLGFINHEKEKIYSLRKNTESREFFIKQGSDSNVYSIEVPLEEHAIITSNPNERNHLLYLKHLFKGNINNAVNQWVHDKKNNLIK